MGCVTAITKQSTSQPPKVKIGPSVTEKMQLPSQSSEEIYSSKGATDSYQFSSDAEDNRRADKLGEASPHIFGTLRKCQQPGKSFEGPTKTSRGKSNPKARKSKSDKPRTKVVMARDMAGRSYT